MKKKLIFVTEALWIGGIETALINLLKHLDYEKYDVTCLILRDDRTMASHLPEQCSLIVADREHVVSFQHPYQFSRLFHLTEEASNPSPLHRALMFLVPAIRWIENRLYIRYVRENLKEKHFDTCVIYSDRAAETAARGIRADKYLMFYHHGAMRREYHDEIGYRKSKEIIAVSNVVETALRSFRPRYAHKMITIHNLADVAGLHRKAADSISEVFSPETFHIVSCGRVSREKGMDLAVEACAELVRNGHRNIHWWIVGGGPAEGEVRRKISDLHMEDHVTMLGMKRNPWPYIQQADLYVQPSRFEGYPMTILEALILGRVVVSTANGGAAELIRNGETGLLCPISASGIADAVQKLLENPTQLEGLWQNVAAIDMESENQKIIQQIEEWF